MRKITAMSTGVAIGILATVALSSAARGLLALNDPAYQCADQYLSTGVFQIGDKPISAELASAIARQCKDEIARQSVIRRFNAAHPLSGPLIGAFISLLDPLMLVALVVISSIASFLLINLAHKRTSGGHPAEPNGGEMSQANKAYMEKSPLPLAGEGGARSATGEG